MINFYNYTNKNKTENNSKWLYIPSHPQRIIRGSGYVKTNALLNLINKHLDIDKIYLYAKDPCEVKYQFFIKKKRTYRIKVF